MRKEDDSQAPNPRERENAIEDIGKGLIFKGKRMEVG